jgi:DMSO/TMAO reductase YedYZ molybdopterin-dependent catalytic subunit
MRYARMFRAVFLVAGFSLRLAHAQTPAQNAAASELTVRGDIPAPLTLKADDLARMPRETVTVPDQDGTKVSYEGVPLREIL